ncbi:protein neprosin-like [Aristolochia californica]|uniref:protein neprosin-like n=1 Tax=Aristolochia californica TaxID=171875 RepID=UPI0035DBC7BB
MENVTRRGIRGIRDLVLVISSGKCRDICSADSFRNKRQVGRTSMAGPVGSRLHVALSVWIAICLAVFCKASEISYEDYVEMNNYLEYINRPAVTTIETEDGDIFDCVDIYKQPALDHPALRDHIIQMEPASVPDGINIEPSSYITMKTGLPDGGCPVGTVPIIRMQMEELLKAGSVSNLMNKYGRSGYSPDQLKVADHQYATASLTTQAGGSYKGTQVSINVWNPPVKRGETFSLAQLWVVNGQGQNLNTIEAGWNVYPGLYGDSATHLFVYWTADNYKKTGCYNLKCAGFVQVSRTITPGMRLPKISKSGGTQEDISLRVFWDEGTKRWWLGYHETQSSTFINVGYWPGSLFKALVRFSNRIDWGGEVVGDTTGTYPPMGSGRFPAEGFRKAAYFKQIKYIDRNLTLRNAPNNIAKLQTRPKCYKIEDKGTGSAQFGRYFFFGGPGGRCARAVTSEKPRTTTCVEDASE